MDAAERIRAFRHGLEERASERVVPATGGVGLFADSVANIYDLNYLRAEHAPADVLVEECERLMEPFHHRKVIVERDGRALVGGFAAHGYVATPHLIMALRRDPDRRTNTSAVREMPFDELVAARREVTVGEPSGDEALSALLDRGKRRIMEAVPTRFFAAFADGEVAAYCELRSQDGVAQIEDVNTLERFRGRGLGRAVVQHAVDVARSESELVFLEALADDWPRELYAKLGFDVVDERVLFLRVPSPLTKLRLRTPRLELRFATVAERRELYRVAAAGIHDPAVMPFEVPWTDDLNEEDFLAHHAQPQADNLTLVAFHEGRPVGVQALRVRLPEVDTGSWLGAEYQGRGLGTEMRAAVLSLAFDHLGAEVARSGAMAANPQSLGVSRKLGYRVVGSHPVSPRGEPIEHTDLELRRDEFASPVPVEVEGAEVLA